MPSLHRGCLFIVLALGTFAAGCGKPVNARFMPTDSRFATHEIQAPPLVYIDRLPERAYDSVGIIEVMMPDTTPLPDVIGAAAEEGRQIGCDVLIDRALHKVAAGEGRWTVALGPAAGDTLGARRRVSPTPWLAANIPIYQPAPQPFLIVPTSHREFICGKYRDSAAPEPAATPAAPAGPPRCRASDLPRWKDADAVLKKKLIDYCRAPAGSPDPGVPTE